MSEGKLTVHFYSMHGPYDPGRVYHKEENGQERVLTGNERLAALGEAFVSTMKEFGFNGEIDISTPGKAVITNPSPKTKELAQNIPFTSRFSFTPAPTTP